MDAVAFLFDLHRGMEKPMGGEGFLSLETFFSLGLRIFRDIEELMIEDVDRAQVLRDGVLGRDTPTAGGRAGVSSRFRSSMTLSILRCMTPGFHPGPSDTVLSLLAFRRTSCRGRGLSLRVFTASLLPRSVSSKRSPNGMEPLLLFQDGPGIGEQISFLGIEPLREKEAK